MEGKRDKLLGGNNGTRRVLNGKGKGGGSHELANPIVHQRRTKILGTSKLLLAIC